MDFGRNVMKEFLGENCVHCGVSDFYSFLNRVQVPCPQYCRSVVGNIVRNDDFDTVRGSEGFAHLQQPGGC